METLKENFTGRRWLYKQIERVLLPQHSPTIALVSGDLGFGKSAAVAYLICNVSSSRVIHDNLIGYYACNFRNEDTWNRGIFIQNLANVIAKNLPEYHRLIKNSVYIKQCLQFPSNCFLEGVLKPLASLKIPDSTKKFIAFDAMDECYDSDKGKIPILQMLLDHLEKFPKWLKIIITSRPQSQYGTLNPNNVRQISVGNYMDESKKDAEEFIMEKLRAAGISNLTHVESVAGIAVKQIAELSNGNFLFVTEMLNGLLNSLRNGQTRIYHFYSFPRVLSDLYFRNFQRHFSQTKDFKLCRQILEIMVADRARPNGMGALTIYKVLSVTNPQSFGYHTDVVDALRQLGHYVRYKDEHTPLEFNHRYVMEWLTCLNRTKENPMFYVSKKKGHNMIADFLLKEAMHRNGNLRFEFVEDLALHISAGGMDQKRIESFCVLPLQLDCDNTNPVYKRNRELLFIAAGHHNSDFLKLLLLHNISDIDASTNTSLRLDKIYDRPLSPACFAARNGRVKNLKLLVKKGADVNQTCSRIPHVPYTNSLLHVATFNQNEEIVKFLISSKADIYADDKDGFDVLSTALLSPNVNIIRLLLQAGAQRTLSHLCMAAAYISSSQFVIAFGMQDSTSPVTADSRGLECSRVGQTIAHLHSIKIGRARRSFSRRMTYVLPSPLSVRTERELFLDQLFAMSPKNLQCRSVSSFSLQLVLSAGKYLRWNIFLEYIEEVGLVDAFGVCSDVAKTFPNPGKKCVFFLFANRKPNAFHHQVQQFSTVSCNVLLVVMSPISTHKDVGGKTFSTGKSQVCKYSLYGPNNTYKCYLPLFYLNSEILAYFTDVSRILKSKKL